MCTEPVLSAGNHSACEQFTIDFGVVFSLVEKVREVCYKPITERNEAKPKQARTALDTQLKTAVVINIIRTVHSTYLS